MKEPISIFTNAFYIIVGMLLLPNLVGIALIGLGITSGWYHWTKTTSARQWDVRFIYLTMMSIIGYYFYILAETVLQPILIVLLVSGYLWYHIEHYRSTYTIPWMFVFIVGLYSIFTFNVIPILLFTVGYILNIPFLRKYHVSGKWEFWKVDICHGLWHLCTALGFYFFITFI